MLLPGERSLVLSVQQSAIAAAWGIGKIGSSAMESIARQPEAAGNIRTAMLIIGALVEGACLFAIIACLMAIVM